VVDPSASACMQDPHTHWSHSRTTSFLSLRALSVSHQDSHRKRRRSRKGFSHHLFSLPFFTALYSPIQQWPFQLRLPLLSLRFTLEIFILTSPTPNYSRPSVNSKASLPSASAGIPWRGRRSVTVTSTLCLSKTVSLALSIWDIHIQ